MNTIEDVLEKHLGDINLNSLERMYPMDYNGVKAAMQEWASLQTPSNEKYGWVKASERLPEKEGQYYVLMEGWKGTAYFNGNRFETGDWIKIERIQWLDESTPIPLTPCGWTRVEDGLPEDKQLCLVFNSISVEPSVYDRNEFYRYPNDVSGDRCVLYHFDKSKVTHWMPLPTKPNL